MLVTETFANEAVAVFPGRVTRLTEAEALVFWENKGHAHMADERRDVGVCLGTYPHHAYRSRVGAMTR